MQLQHPLKKCDCAAQTLLLQALEVPAAGEKFPSQMGITCVTWLFLCQSTEGLAQLLWLEKTRPWSRCKKKWKGKSDELQIESSKMPSKWQDGTGDGSCHVCATHTMHSLAQGFSSWAASSESHGERRIISGILVLQRKNMKQSEMTEKWECWMMANSIWGAGERELLASLLQCHIPAWLTLISGGQFISAARIWLLGLQVQNEKLSISRAPILVFAKCFLFSISSCKFFFFFFLLRSVENLAKRAVFYQT